MRKNSKNEKVIRAMAIGISAMLMASSPLTALAAEGEGNSSEGNEDKNITVTPEAGVCDQAEAAAKDADKAVYTRFIKVKYFVADVCRECYNHVCGRFRDPRHKHRKEKEGNL